MGLELCSLVLTRNCKIVNYSYSSQNRLRFWLSLGNTCLRAKHFLLSGQAANFVFFL